MCENFNFFCIILIYTKSYIYTYTNDMQGFVLKFFICNETYFPFSAISHEAAMILFTHRSTGTILATADGSHRNVRITPVPAPAIAPVGP